MKKSVRMVLAGLAISLSGCTDAVPIISSLSSTNSAVALDPGTQNPLLESSVVPGGAFRFSGNCKPQVTSFTIQLDSLHTVSIQTGASSYPVFAVNASYINKSTGARQSVVGSMSAPQPNQYDGEYFTSAMNFDLDCSDGKFDFYLFKSSIEWLYDFAGFSSDIPYGIVKPNQVTINPIVPRMAIEPIIYKSDLPEKLSISLDPSRSDNIVQIPSPYFLHDCADFNNHGCVMLVATLKNSSGVAVSADRDYHFAVSFKNPNDEDIAADYFKVYNGAATTSDLVFPKGNNLVSFKIILGSDQPPSADYKLILKETTSTLPDQSFTFKPRNPGSIVFIYNYWSNGIFSMPLAPGLDYLIPSFARYLDGASVTGPFNFTNQVFTSARNTDFANFFAKYQTGTGLSIASKNTSGGYDLSSSSTSYTSLRLKVSDPTRAQEAKVQTQIRSTASTLSVIPDWSNLANISVTGTTAQASTYADSDVNYWYADHNRIYTDSGHPIIANWSEMPNRGMLSVSHVSPEPSPKYNCYELRIARGTAEEAVLFTHAASSADADPNKNTAAVTIQVSGSKLIGTSWVTSATHLNFFTDYNTCNSSATGSNSLGVTLNNTNDVYYVPIYVRYDYPYSSPTEFPLYGKIKLSLSHVGTAKLKEYILYLKGN